jgi:transcriptional regulator with XRE-family HTH domain
MAKEIEEICAGKLREIRRKRGLTLHGFESLSNGSVKAVVLGSYERGTRAVSLERLEHIAAIYEVPIQYFFGISNEGKSESDKSFIFDLRRISKRSELSPQLTSVKRYLAQIASQRSDWNGEVISLRRADSDCLALICEMGIGELTTQLRGNGFLFASEVSGQHSL